MCILRQLTRTSKGRSRVQQLNALKVKQEMKSSAETVHLMQFGESVRAAGPEDGYHGLKGRRNGKEGLGSGMGVQATSALSCLNISQSQLLPICTPENGVLRAPAQGK